MKFYAVLKSVAVAAFCYLPSGCSGGQSLELPSIEIRRQDFLTSEGRSAVLFSAGRGYEGYFIAVQPGTRIAGIPAELITRGFEGDQGCVWSFASSEIGDIGKALSDYDELRKKLVVIYPAFRGKHIFPSVKAGIPAKEYFENATGYASLNLSYSNPQSSSHRVSLSISLKRCDSELAVKTWGTSPWPEKVSR